MEREDNYSPKESYVRVATACPEVNLADVPTNISRIKELYDEAISENVSLVVFPELSITGYTLGDLVQQNSLLNQAETGLADLASYSKDKNCSLVVGLPFRFKNGLYNCAAVISEGEVKGLVPKANLPTYNEFYEDRWFQTYEEIDTEAEFGKTKVPFGNNIIFNIDGAKLGIEICEDLWVAEPPSGKLAKFGANLIANPSASPEQIAKASYRYDLVKMQSARLICGYLYAGCDESESTAEIVMGGHQLIASNNVVLSESRPFSKARLILNDIDLEYLEFDRRKVHMASKIGALVVETEVKRSQNNLVAQIDRNPYLPESESLVKRNERLETALAIQAHGLANRMRATHQERLVLGLSGGLDSTLALIVAKEAAQILGKDSEAMIHTITMPGLASSDMTQSNASKLARELGVFNCVIPISELSKAELAALSHDGKTQDVTYENVQARARTNLLFNYANLHHCLVLGTGDLSEIALGWCTYNADQQSHYNVNASIPKTMVYYLVDYATKQERFTQAKTTLAAIRDTVISPELTSSNEGKISQSTEDIIGPYKLHDFYLYHLVRYGDKPSKINYLARQAFEGIYSGEDISKWLGVFIKRFAGSQFKRENIPNGPKVGSVSLSPRGDWRMPPDLYNAAVWQV